MTDQEEVGYWARELAEAGWIPCCDGHRESEAALWRLKGCRESRRERNGGWVSPRVALRKLFEGIKFAEFERIEFAGLSFGEEDDEP